MNFLDSVIDSTAHLGEYAAAHLATKTVRSNFPQTYQRVIGRT